MFVTDMGNYRIFTHAFMRFQSTIHPLRAQLAVCLFLLLSVAVSGSQWHVKGLLLLYLAPLQFPCRQFNFLPFYSLNFYQRRVAIARWLFWCVWNGQHNSNNTNNIPHSAVALMCA